VADEAESSKLSAELTDEGARNGRNRESFEIDFLQSPSSGPTGHLPPGGKALGAVFERLPPGGKLSAELTDEGARNGRNRESFEIDFLQSPSSGPSGHLPPGGKALGAAFERLPPGGEAVSGAD